MDNKLDKILAETKPGKLISNLVDYVTDPDLGGVTNEDLKEAPPLVKGVIFVNAFDLDISTSSVVAWLIENYDHFPTLANFFDKIGAKSASRYLRSAYALFPNGRVIRDQDKRYTFCNEHEEQFVKIDRKFKGASEEAILKLRNYIVSKRKTFEAQVEKFWQVRKRHFARWNRDLQKLRRRS